MRRKNKKGETMVKPQFHPKILYHNVNCFASSILKNSGTHFLCPKARLFIALVSALANQWGQETLRRQKAGQEMASNLEDAPRNLDRAASCPAVRIGLN